MQEVEVGKWMKWIWTSVQRGYLALMEVYMGDRKVFAFHRLSLKGSRFAQRNALCCDFFLEENGGGVTSVWVTCTNQWDHYFGCDRDGLFLI